MTLTREQQTAILFALEIARRYYLRRAVECAMGGFPSTRDDYKKRAHEAETLGDLFQTEIDTQGAKDNAS